MERNFDQIVNQIKTMAAGSNMSLGEALGKAGISPDNPDLLLKLLAEAGYDNVGLGDTSQVIKTIEGLVSTMDPQMRQRLGGLLGEVTSSFKSVSVPPDVKAFIERLHGPNH